MRLSSSTKERRRSPISRLDERLQRLDVRVAVSGSMVLLFFFIYILRTRARVQELSSFS